MKRPRIRIGTLMLLVVIAALAVALIDSRRKLATLGAELEARRAQSEEALASFVRVLTPQPPAAVPARANPFGLNPVVFSEVAARIASDDLGGVPAEEVEADLAAIGEGATGPVEITEASAPYVVYRRDKKQSRAEALRSARLELRFKSATEAVEKAATK